LALDAIVSQRRTIIESSRLNGSLFSGSTGRRTDFVDGISFLEAIKTSFAVDAVVIARIVFTFDRDRTVISADINVVAKIVAFFFGKIVS